MYCKIQGLGEEELNVLTEDYILFKNDLTIKVASGNSSTLEDDGSKSNQRVEKQPQNAQ